MRENTAHKGRRYVLEARLFVTAVDGGHVEGTCRGNGEIYTSVTHTARGWQCSSEARTDCRAHPRCRRALVEVRPAS